MNDLITVIIPVYNVKKYLEKCVDSVIKQTYQNIEILLIDDGSTDGSSLLCDNLKEQDCRIKVYHKKNGGLSDARNFGISKANGKYLVFIDSDDWIDSTYIEYLYDLLITYNCDVSICEIVKITEDGKIVSTNLNNNYIIKMNQKEAIRNMIEVNYYATSACGKMYKKECFNNCLFPIGRLFEDIPTNYNIFLTIDNVVFGARGLYFYLTREGSITRKKFSIKNLDNIYFIEDSMKKVITKYPSFKNIADIRIFLAYFDVWKSFSSIDKKSDYYNKVINMIRQLRFNIILNKQVKFSIKIKAILTYLPISIVRLIFYLMKK